MSSKAKKKSRFDHSVSNPFDSKKVAQEVKRRGLKLSCILTTHSHFDHAGGNKDLLKRVPSISAVYGGKNDKVPECTKEVEEGDTFNIGKNLSVSVMYTPCHTPGHVCYVVKASDCAPSVFTGDALFVSGCGNFNTGTPAQMASAFERLGKLPMNTLVWAGHEYTVSNLAYACFVEPESKILRAKTEWAKSQLTSKAFTVPSTIQEEHEMNPFMRAVYGVDVLVKHCGTDNPVRAIKFVREEKSSGSWKMTKLNPLPTTCVRVSPI
eukprot:g3447.t1